MKIATWNVNSIKARMVNTTEWLRTAAPDVLLLQEIKCLTADFPTLELQALGYRAAVVGQRTYNGVAILSRLPITDVIERLPGDGTDDQARYVEGTVDGLRVASIYLPNGNPVASDKYPYKLAWMARLRDHVQTLLASERAFVLGGDYNVAPTDDDVYDPLAWQDDALCRPPTRAAFRRIMHLGLIDAFRAVDERAGQYTYWDYQAGRWQRDEGLRIDHLLLSPQAADRLAAAGIDRGPRGRDKASDHTPIWCELK